MGGALFHEQPAVAGLLKSCLFERLGAVLTKKGFVVNGHPQLQGRWDNGRMTLTQQSVSNGVFSVQLELSLSLRKELNKNKELRHLVSHAIHAAFTEVLRRCSRAEAT